MISCVECGKESKTRHGMYRGGLCKSCYFRIRYYPNNRDMLIQQASDYNKNNKEKHNKYNRKYSSTTDPHGTLL